MKTLCFILLLQVIPISIFSQRFEDLAGAGIDFLLRNPRTANKMDPGAAVALDIIGDLFKNESERKNQLEYANAGRNQITINTNNGEQAQLVKSENGKVFLLIDGVIYPISQEIVSQATTNSFSEEPVIEENSNELNLEDIKNKYIENYSTYKIKTVFPFKWWRDFNGNEAMDFDEIKQIKRTYYDNENITIALVYSLPVNGKARLLTEVLNEYSGNSILSFEDEVSCEYSCSLVNHSNLIEPGDLPPGSYIIYSKLINAASNEVLSNYSETIKIIEGNPSTREKSQTEIDYKKKIGISVPRGIFYYTAVQPIDSETNIESKIFSGLNQPEYSLDKPFWVALNFPEKYGEVIIQIKNQDGKILDAKTQKFQTVLALFICKNCLNDIPSSINDEQKEALDFLLPRTVEINSPGIYKIVANFVEGGSYEQKVIIK